MRVPPPRLPPVVSVGPYQKMVKLEHLPPGKRQALWTSIKNNSPETAELMRSNAVQTLKEMFDGSLVMTQVEIDLFVTKTALGVRNDNK